MWIDAGFDPDAFWPQTPHSLQVCMEGVRKRMQREAEGRLIAAYETASFVATAQAGKLKPLEHYLKKSKAQKSQSPKDMVATLEGMKSSGAPMTIRKVDRRRPGG